MEGKELNNAGNAMLVEAMIVVSLPHIAKYIKRYIIKTSEFPGAYRALNMEDIIFPSACIHRLAHGVVMHLSCKKTSQSLAVISMSSDALYEVDPRFPPHL